jgi:hypothetical protein
MASKVRVRGLETRTARSRLTVRPKPYHFMPIAPGIAIGYRRNTGPGVWVARVADGKGGNWTRTVGLADDFEDADGTNALTFWQATDKILKLVRGSRDAARRPTTIAEVIDQYEKDLAARGRSVSNARRIRKHLPRPWRPRSSPYWPSATSARGVTTSLTAACRPRPLCAALKRSRRHWRYAT